MMILWVLTDPHSKHDVHIYVMAYNRVDARRVARAQGGLHNEKWTDGNTTCEKYEPQSDVGEVIFTLTGH